VLRGTQHTLPTRGFFFTDVVAAGPDDDNPRHHKFLVKWVGYGHEENTWETYEHIADIGPDLLRKYYDEHPHITPDARMTQRRSRRNR
jgi:hypothetical protein